jgi:hypothetical protein
VGNGLAEKGGGFRHFALILGCARSQVNEEGKLAAQLLIDAVTV